MEIRFRDDKLERLATDTKFAGGFTPALVKVFRKRMQMIKAAPDERDFYKLKSLHYEKLSGARDHQHSMRLNDKYRLIIEYETADNGKVVLVISIEDYH